MPSRRTVLASGFSAAGFALAGCLEGLPESEPDTTDWHYDAGERFDAPTVATATVDMSAAREAPLPDPVGRALENLDEDIESVEISDIESLAVTGYADFEETYAGASGVALGEFDPDAIGEELEADGFDHDGSAEEFERYEAEQRDPSFAVSEFALVAGFSEAPDMVASAAVVDAALEAHDGDVSSFTDRENGSTLWGELDGDVSIAVDMGDSMRATLESDFEDAPGPLGTVFGSADAFGVDATFDGDTTDLTYLLVADGDELDVETVRAVATELEDADESTIQGISVSRDGRAVVATAEADTEALLESHFGVLQPAERERSPTPRVQFDIERTDDDRVAVVHEGGDSIGEPLSIRYGSPDGSREEEWDETPIRAGDRFISGAEASPDTEVSVVWESEDGMQAAMLARTTV